MMSGNSCLACKTNGIVASVLFVATTLIALMAAYNTHFVAGAFVAGTPEGSLALLTLLFSGWMLSKALKKACPCGGCGCGGNCNCGPTK